MWLRRPLDDILSSPAKVAVLRAVLRVSAPLSGREIARRSGVGYSPAYNALQALVASGVLSRQDHGKVTTYTVRDPAAPLVAGLRDLFDREEQRSHAAVAELAQRLPDAQTIVLFGSEARGDARPGSDTDLLIVVARADTTTSARVQEACLELAEQYALALSWQVVDLDQLREWEATGDQFWHGVLADGIWLHGDSLEAIRLKWRLGKTTTGKPAASGT
jgi:predicted nucleotidyltransferase